jgi:hypothetical protein
MADAKVTAFPTAAATGVRAKIERILTTKHNLEKAEGDLRWKRTTRDAERIDAFAAASRTPLVLADAVRARLDLEALRKTFDDQAAAIDFWKREIDYRLDQLTAEFGSDAISVLNEQIAGLREQRTKEQGGVNETNSLIAELEQRLAAVQKVQSTQVIGSASARKGS